MIPSSYVAWGIIGMTIGEVTVAGSTLVVSVSAVTAATGGIVSATNYVLDKVQNTVVNDLAKGGYHKIMPGQTYTTGRMTSSLNLRAWLVRIKKTHHSILIRRSDSSVWTGSTSRNNNIYNVLDNHYFSTWKTETIPINVQIPTETSSTIDENYSIVEPGVSIVESGKEDPSSSWVHVDTK